MTLVSNAYAQVDPCTVTPNVGQGQKISLSGNQVTGNSQGYSYEVWRNGGGSGSITLYNQAAAFRADWNNAGDFLGRVGKSWGNTPSVDNLGGNLVVNYQFEKSNSEGNNGSDGGSYSYIGIYGWMNNPQIEYYIVEDWLHDRGTPGGNYIGREIGEIMVDGEIYKVWSGQRTGESKWGTSTFTQIFSIRQSRRQCGTIHISEHFRQWKALGLTLGGLMECQILAEAGGGQGHVDFKYATIDITDDSGDGNDGKSVVKEPTEPEGPYKGVFSIPGKIESEDYDMGGNGFGYKDSDNKNETSEYRNDGVDIEAGGTGYAIGHTSTSEWLKYSINVEKDGKYDIYANCSNGQNDVEIILELDDKELCTLSGSGNGGDDWKTYKLVSKKSVSLSKGEHALKVKFGTMYCNIDYIEIVAEGEGAGSGSGPGSTGGSTGDSTTTTTSGASTFFDGNGAYFGPDCDDKKGDGAYYTGVYTSPFTTLLGKSEEDIQKKLDQLWNHYFKGDDNSKVYYDQGNDAYIMDTGNNDVRSEGMSYGMMISVQTDHRQEFDKLWNWAKKNMWHKNDEWDGYFSWQIRLNGGADNKPAPDGEMYFMMALLFAANRWNDSQYMEDAQYILDRMWNNRNYKLFNESQYIVTFQPTQGNKDFSDPSYDLPAFLELFSRWSNTSQDKWSKAVTATRDHLYRSSHSSTGLFTDYNNFDGTPHSGFDSNNPSDTYMFDAIRCAMNFGMDYYLFGVDKTREKEMAKKIIDFFDKDNYSHAHFNWDGSLVNNHYNDPYTLGQKGANAVATYALLDEPSYKDKVIKNLTLAWEGTPLTGSQRYYDGLVHFLAMLHLTGHFKIWKPQPTIETKSVEANEYNGVTYKEETVIDSYEDCQLYKVTIKPISDPTSVEEIGSDNDVILMPNPAENFFTVESAQEISSIEIFNTIGQMVYSQNNGEMVEINLPAGTYLVKILTVDGYNSVHKLMVK